jgi:hypothetical protein
MVDVIPKNLQMRVLMWFQQEFIYLQKRIFLIWSNKDPKIEATYAQIDF